MIVFASRAHGALPNGDAGLIPAPRFG
jgi:hypothetical protein